MKNRINIVEINSRRIEIVNFFRHYSSSIADYRFITLYGSVCNFVFAKKNKYEKVDVPSGFVDEVNYYDTFFLTKAKFLLAILVSTRSRNSPMRSR